MRAKTRFRHANKNSRATQGVDNFKKSDFTLAPLLFIIAIDYIMRKTLEGFDLGFTIQPRRSRRYPAKKLTDADYADDLALLADTIDGAQVFLARLEEFAASVGLHINGSKTRYMTNSIDPDHSDEQH